jgi:hypothetical protein
MARRFASLVPFYEYDQSRFFSTDGAPENIVASRRAGFMRLSKEFAERFKKTADLTGEIAGGVSDLQFTSRYRVPFQFSGYVRQHFKSGTIVESSSGVTVTDLDGNRLYDLTGSSTCRAPKRSCRRCGSRAITPGARTWSASAAPTTGGGAMCSPASAIRWPLVKPTP